MNKSVLLDHVRETLSPSISCLFCHLKQVLQSGQFRVDILHIHVFILLCTIRSLCTTSLSLTHRLITSIIFFVLYDPLGLDPSRWVRQYVYVYRFLINHWPLALSNALYNSTAWSFPGRFLVHSLTLIPLSVQSVVHTASSCLLLALVCTSWFLLSDSSGASIASVIATASILDPSLWVRTCGSLSPYSSWGGPGQSIVNLWWLRLISSVISSRWLPGVRVLSETASNSAVWWVSQSSVISCRGSLLLWPSARVTTVRASPTWCSRPSSHRRRDPSLKLFDSFQSVLQFLLKLFLFQSQFLLIRPMVFQFFLAVLNFLFLLLHLLTCCRPLIVKLRLDVLQLALHMVDIWHLWAAHDLSTVQREATGSCVSNTWWLLRHCWS